MRVGEAIPVNSLLLKTLTPHQEAAVEALLIEHSGSYSRPSHHLLARAYASELPALVAPRTSVYKIYTQARDQDLRRT